MLRPCGRRGRLRIAVTLLVVATVTALACGGGATEQPFEASPTARPIDESLAATGAPLYATYCASCHGANGEGEPEWKVRRDDGTLPAPPHDATGHTWHHADGLLFRIVRDGCAAYNAESSCRMPAFGGTLSDEEIVAVIEYLRAWWRPQDRLFQEQVSRNDPFSSP